VTQLRRMLIAEASARRDLFVELRETRDAVRRRGAEAEALADKLRDADQEQQMLGRRHLVLTRRFLDLEAEADALRPSPAASDTSNVLKMPGRAKADLSIANMFKQNDPNPNLDKFRVYVKNTGSVDSPASKMSINSSSGGGEVSVPAIVANSGQWVEVQFFAFEDGSRIRLMVDSHKKVAESNESNNVYAFNW